MQENKKRDIRKDGVDFLIKQGYKNLSNKTFISDIDLEKFLNKDFDNINKTRALGFIQILEREYDVNLDDLKKEYLEHETTHRKPKPETLFIEKPIKEENEWKKYIPYAAGAIALLGVAFYLFRPTASGVKTAEPSPVIVEENKSILKKAETNLDKFETNKTQNNNISTLENSLNKAPALEEEDDLDLDKVVLQLIKERNISVEADENKTATTLKTDQNKTAESNSSKENKTAIVKSSKEEVKKKNPQDDIPIAKTIPITKPASKTEKNKKSKKSKKKKSAMGDLYIKPIQKAWVGVIYLDTMTKKDFLIRKKLKLDATRDQLIVVGHRHFKIYNKTYSVNFTAKGPVRFIYRDGELMEINKKEFLKTSEGVMW